MLEMVIQIAAGQVVVVIFTKLMSLSDCQDPYLHNLYLSVFCV